MVLLGLAAGGCGPRARPNGVWPGPVGEAAVILWGAGDRALPVACYDPLWARLRGPTDCADLVPPGVALRPLDGGEGPRVVDRRPIACPAGGVALTLDGPGARGWLLWPPGLAARAEGPAVWADLDADGAPERVAPPACEGATS